MRLDARMKAMYQELSMLLEELRVTSGLTADELSIRLGKPSGYIASFGRNSKGLDPFDFAEIVTALGKDPIEQMAAYDQRLRKVGLFQR